MRRHLRLSQDWPEWTTPDGITLYPTGTTFVPERFARWAERSGARAAPIPLPTYPTERRRTDVPPAFLPELPEDRTHRWPWIYPPQDAFAFALTNVPQNVNPAQTVDLITFQELPRGQAGVITHFGNNASDFVNLQWTILLAGVPVPPIAALALNFGAVNNPVRLPGAGVILAPGQSVVVRAVNVGVGIIANVQAVIHGYLWQLWGP